MAESTRTPATPSYPPRRLRGLAWLVGGGVVVALFLLARSSYLLFHTGVELFSVVVGCSIFVVAWNTRRWVSNDYLLFLGVSYLFVAAADTFHALSYPGMGVFPSFGPNEPTQFWILARYLEAFSLLAAPVFLTRRLRLVPVAAAYASVTGFGLLAIGRLGIFPACFVEGSGLTTFKIASEYAICAVLVGGIVVLSRHRSSLAPQVFRLLVGAMATTIAAELSFTLYADVYGVMNMVGHLFKVVSFFLVYRAVVATSLSTPYEVLFRDLTLSHARAQAYLDMAGTILVAFDVEGKVQLINRRGADVLGYAADEIVGRNWFDDFLPESRRETGREITRRLIGGDIGSGEYTEGYVVTRGGTERLIAWHNTVLRDAEGAIVSTLCSGEDITERSAAETRLVESERRFRLLFDQAPDAYYLHDIEGRFVDVNAAGERMSGYTRDELLGRSVLECGLFPADCVDLLVESLSRNSRGEPAGPNEYTLIRKDGSVAVVEVRSEPIRSGGVPVLVLGSARDVTERRRSEDQIRLQRDYFMSLFSNSPEGIALLDSEFRIVDVNDAFRRMFGYSPEDIVGRELDDVVVPEAQLGEAREMTRLGREGRFTFSVEAPRKRRDGSLLDVSIVGAPIVSGGRLEGAFIIFRDVTERRRAEAALRASEDKYRALFEQSIDAIYVTARDGTHVEANRAWLDLFGYTADELPSIDAARDVYVDPHDRDDFLRRIEKTNFVADEVRFKKKDGTILDCQRTVVARRDEQGKIVAFQGIMRDVSERRRQEESLRKSEGQFRALFEQSRDAIYLFAPDGAVRNVNDAAVRLLGYSREQLLAMKDEALYVDESLRPVVLKKLHDEGGLQEYPLQFRTRDGGIKDCEVTATVMKSPDGTLSGYQILIRDVTERKLARAEAERNEARLRSLVAILQHESDSVREFLDYALNEAIALTESRIGYVFHYDEDLRIFTLNTWSRDVMKECTIQAPMRRYPLENAGIWGEVVRQRRPVVVNDFVSPPPYSKGLPKGHAPLRKFASIPILSGGRIVATVGVANKESDYTDTDVLQLTLLIDAVWRVVERKQSEDRAHESAQRLEEAMSAGNLAWWQMELPSGKVSFDERKATMLGFPPSQFSYYGDFTALLHPEDHDAVMQAMREHLEGKAERYQTEYRLQTAEGGYRWFRDVGGVTKRDESGSPALVTGVVVDITSLKSAEEQLARSIVELRDLAARFNVAREEERAAVAWELHDEVAQALAVMKLDITACANRLPADIDPNVVSSVERLASLLDSTIARLRRLYSDLVPVMLEDLGLASAIEWQTEQSREHTGVDVRIGHVEDLRLANERVTLGLFRVLQDALSHVSTHPGATTVTVDLERRDGQAVLRVTDNGEGFADVGPETSCGMALAGIRERARSWGGTMRVDSVPSQGTVLEVTVPLLRE